MPWAEMIHSGIAGWVARQRDADGRLVAAPDHTWEGVGEIEIDPADDRCLWAKRGPGILLSSREGRTADLFSRAELGSCDLYLEFLIPAESNVGVYLIGQYEVPLGDEPPETGDWQTLELTFLAPRFDESGRKSANARLERVLLNGTPLHERIEFPGPTRGALSRHDLARGPLRLRGDHGPIAFRDIRVRTIFE